MPFSASKGLVLPKGVTISDEIRLEAHRIKLCEIEKTQDFELMTLVETADFLRNCQSSTTDDAGDEVQTRFEMFW